MPSTTRRADRGHWWAVQAGMELANEVRTARLSAGLSQSALARGAGVAGDR